MINMSMFSNKKDRSMSDYLNYAAMIKDGVLTGKNDGLTAAFSYTPFDTHNLSIEERANYCEILNNRFKELGENWTIEVNFEREGVDSYGLTGEFSSDITRAIEHERRTIMSHKGYQFQSKHTLYLTWTPPNIAKQKLASSVSGYKSSFELNVEKFEEKIKHFGRDLSELGVRRLGSYSKTSQSGDLVSYDAFLENIKASFTGEHQPLLTPPCPAYLDSYLVHEDLINHGSYLSYGKKNISVIHIDGFISEHSYPMMSEALSFIDTDYRWHTRFIILEQNESESIIKMNRKKWSQQIISLKDQMFNNMNARRNSDALHKANESDFALNQVKSRDVAYGYFTSAIILINENLESLKKDRECFVAALKRVGLQTRIEDINLFEAYLGSLPGHIMYNIRKPIINTRNLVHFLPISGNFKGFTHNPSDLFPKSSPALMQTLAADGESFYFNIHQNDLGHTMVVSPGGAGKSFKLSLIAAQFDRYENAQVYILDNKNSALALALACGSHFDVDADSKFSLSPLAMISTKTDILWGVSWILDILALQGCVVDQEIKEEVERALRSTISSDSKTLSSFYHSVRSHSIALALKPYLKDGALGELLDSDVVTEDHSRLQCYEMYKLLQLGGLKDNDKYLLPVLSVLFNRIEKKLDGRPTLIIIDECWMAFKNKVFSSRVGTWLVTLRKSNAAVVMATTNMSHFLESSIADEIMTACQTKIFPPNNQANTESQSSYYKRFGLNDAQIDIIANANPKSDYYYFSPSGSRLYKTGRGRHSSLKLPYHNAFLGSSSESYARRIKALHKEHGEKWIQHWLEERNR